MAYFPPYIDSAGLHMPTYEDRLAALVESYRSIFGIESELSESVPDYQLLSVIARSLDDASALTLSAFQNMNPQYAQGQALDLMLPLYGLTREPGETDASVRSRMLTSIANNGKAMEDAIRAEILSVPYVQQVVLHINDTDSTDAQGVPAHTICPLVVAGRLQSIAEAIYLKKPPGIGTFGTTTKQVVDENGVSHDISIYRPQNSYITFSIWIDPLEGLDDSILFAVARGLADHIRSFKIGQSLIVPSVYGVCYAAAGEHANTFAISDLATTSNAAGGTTRIRVPCPWNATLTTAIELIRISTEGGASGTWFTFDNNGERQYVPAG